MPIMPAPKQSKNVCIFSRFSNNVVNYHLPGIPKMFIKATLQATGQHHRQFHHGCPLSDGFPLWIWMGIIGFKQNEMLRP